MNRNFRNRYRSESLRLQGFDYGSEGIYFITICTQRKIHYFGKIVDGEVHLSDAGKIVSKEWQNTETLRERVILGEWIVMPNHMHMVIYLKDNTANNPRDGNRDYKNRFGPQRDNISSIIRGFKSTCTKQIRTSCIPDFKWQRGFYDHIVRDQTSLLRIEDYIKDNPRKWAEDKYYKA